MHDIELKQISVFMAVRELGGLTAAQARLGMSCSAISKSLADLEVRLGCKLCLRGRSGFQITKEGERFYNAASKLQESIQGFKSDIDGINNEKANVIRVGIVDATLTDVNNPLPGILKRLQRQYKNIEFKIQVSNSIDIADKLLVNELDIGLTYQQGLRVPLKAIELYKEELVFVIDNNHPLKKTLQSLVDTNNPKTVPKDEVFNSLLATWINHYGLVSFIHKHEVAELFDAFKSKACLKKEWTETDNVEYQQINNIEEILWRVSTSANIGLVPDHLVSGQLDKSLYCFHADDDCNSSMFAVYRDEKKRDEFLNDLVSELKSHVQ